MVSGVIVHQVEEGKPEIVTSSARKQQDGNPGKDKDTYGHKGTDSQWPTFSPTKPNLLLFLICQWENMLTSIKEYYTNKLEHSWFMS